MRFSLGLVVSFFLVELYITKLSKKAASNKENSSDKPNPPRTAAGNLWEKSPTSNDEDDLAEAERRSKEMDEDPEASITWEQIKTSLDR